MARARNEAAASRRQRNGAASARRRKATLANARHTMRNAVGDDVAAMRAEVDDMIASLEQRIQRLNQLTKRGAAHATEGANDVLLNTISGLTGHVASSVQANAQSMSDDVARMGNHALRRVVKEIDQRPLLTLAIAAGIGFLAGLARRPE